MLEIWLPLKPSFFGWHSFDFKSTHFLDLDFEDPDHL